MQVIQSLSAWKELRPQLTGALGLIPTMGALHEGHLALMRRAREENEIAVLWIFVNPKQFAEDADFGSYPRVMEEDLRLAGECGMDYVLAPGAREVYPEDFQTYVEVEQLSQPLEGAHRAGHFRGVATVVAKMLCLTQPQRAYFGQKDAQQTLVVKRMVEDLGMLTEIVVCPTVRDQDGLALSSRNARLSPRERKAALVLYRALKDVETALRCGERDCEVLRGRMRDILGREPRAEVEYVSIADPNTLAECATVSGPVLASLAVQIGDTRLIDNLPLTISE
ncbi:MAG: pantoate--beta-alanine ligase [SAR324 cluster bacterium]|nr:pantoate--beta-alanine ligase [SAR324 cluster bacterium]MCZ6843961.1 pantoate--beta-alanine ligase [SAR324 cluster bacterium]